MRGTNCTRTRTIAGGGGDNSAASRDVQLLLKHWLVKCGASATKADHTSEADEDMSAAGVLSEAALVEVFQHLPAEMLLARFARAA